MWKEALESSCLLYGDSCFNTIGTIGFYACGDGDCEVCEAGSRVTLDVNSALLRISGFSYCSSPSCCRNATYKCWCQFGYSANWQTRKGRVTIFKQDSLDLLVAYPTDEHVNLLRQQHFDVFFFLSFNAQWASPLKNNIFTW